MLLELPRHHGALVLHVAPHDNKSVADPLLLISNDNNTKHQPVSTPTDACFSIAPFFMTNTCSALDFRCVVTIWRIQMSFEIPLLSRHRSSHSLPVDYLHLHPPKRPILYHKIASKCHYLVSFPPVLPRNPAHAQFGLSRPPIEPFGPCGLQRTLQTV